MKYPKLIAGLLAIGILASGCSRHPKVDFSVPTETTAASETTVSETAAFTAPTEAAEPGFDSYDEAYQAFLDAVEAQDVDAFCALFSADEAASAGSVPQKFLKNRFGVKLDSEYQSYLSRTEPDAFRKMVSANFSSYQNEMMAFGTAGE